LVVIGGARWLRRRRLTLFERAGRMMASTLTVDGQSYTSMDELPPEAQEALEQVREAFRDADQDGTPDIMEGMDAQVLDLRSMRAGAGSAERMRELKRMLDEGLISLDEYEEKKGQILSEL
jgi:hypothetical protein